MWHVTCDTWHVTHDTWHMTPTQLPPHTQTHPTSNFGGCEENLSNERRGLLHRGQTYTRTDRQTSQLYDWIGPVGRFSENALNPKISYICWWFLVFLDEITIGSCFGCCMNSSLSILWTFHTPQDIVKVWSFISKCVIFSPQEKFDPFAEFNCRQQWHWHNNLCGFNIPTSAQMHYLWMCLFTYIFFWSLQPLVILNK